jgi:hypothetical protein
MVSLLDIYSMLGCVLAGGSRRICDCLVVIGLGWFMVWQDWPGAKWPGGRVGVGVGGSPV